MNTESAASNKTFELKPIGCAHSDMDEMEFSLEILPVYRPALEKLDHFSHVIAVWWADKMDNPEARALVQTDLPYAEGVRAGVFACRSEYRPNPVALTVCKILEVDQVQGLVRLEYIDAFEGTPVLDLKGYFPICDRVRDVVVPEWAADWPEWIEDAYKLQLNFECE